MAPVDTFLEQLRGEQVTIVVGAGEDSKQYHLPKALLCSRSTWFNNALKDDRFKEAQTSIIHLSEDHPRAFDHFVLYLYKDDVRFASIPPASDDFADQLSGQLLESCQIWAFGDKYLLPAFQNCATHRVCNLLFVADSTLLSAVMLRQCWLTVPDGSPVRLLIADYVVRSIASDTTSCRKFEDLAGAPGFLQQLHSSEAYMHNNKNEFPRFAKPTKHADSLYIEFGSVEQTASIVDYGWNAPPWESTCHECGFYEEVTPVCSNCRDSLRDCQCQDSPSELLLCSECLKKEDE